MKWIGISMWISRSSAKILVAMKLLECRCYFLGVESIEFDAYLGLAFRLNEEPHDVARWLAEAHTQ